jgi:hypothetical protein
MSHFTASPEAAALHPLGTLSILPLELREKIYYHAFHGVVIHYCTSSACIRKVPSYRDGLAASKDDEDRLDHFRTLLATNCAGHDMDALMGRPIWHR